MILYLLILLPLLAATCMYLVRSDMVRLLAVLFQGFMLGLSVYVFIQVRREGTLLVALGGWEAPLGIMLQADAIAAGFLVLTAFLFLICFLLGLYETYTDSLFVFLFMALQSLLMAVFMVRDLFSVSLVLEVSTILVAILIMYKKDSRSIYDGLVYLILNIAGMTFFLFGVAMIYKRFGVLDLVLVGERMARADPALSIMPFAFLFTGVALKCAIIPVFFWLPKAHATPSAPSMVSAILSGLYVKAGMFLLLRLQDIFDFLPFVDDILLTLGILTALGGVVMGLVQRDIKLVLAYSTISQLGLVLTGLSLGSETAWWGAVLHMFHHAIFKSLLFLTAGLVIHEYGTRDINRIRGLATRMPVVAAATSMGVLGIAGAPFFNGSISKYFMQGVNGGWGLQVVMLLINFGTMLLFLKYSAILSGKGVRSEKGEWTQQATIASLGLVCLLGGVFGIPLVNLLFGQQLYLRWDSYLEKTAVFFATLIVAASLWSLFIRQWKPVREGVTIEPTFNTMGALLAALFGGLLAVGMLFTRI